jgi:hypothetical protein
LNPLEESDLQGGRGCLRSRHADEPIADAGNGALFAAKALHDLPLERREHDGGCDLAGIIAQQATERQIAVPAASTRVNSQEKSQDS